MLLWSGQRRGEIAALRRSFINPIDKTATLPPALTKNKKEHVYVLGDDTLAFLKSLPGTTDLYFPAKHSEDATISGWSNALTISFRNEHLSLVATSTRWTSSAQSSLKGVMCSGWKAVPIEG